MSTTSQVTDFSDLYGDLLNRIRAQTGSAGPQDVMKRYINQALQDIHIGLREKVPWAERKATLITQPSYSTGTVSIAKGSTTLTGTGTAWNTTNVFGANNVRTTGKLVLAGGREIYEIASVGGDTAITLASRFTQDDLTDASYVYFEDEYALASDFLCPVNWKNFDIARQISLVPRNEFRERFPAARTPGKPQVACVTDHAPSGNTTPIRRVQLWKPPDEAYTLPYNYITSKLAVSSAGVAQENLSADTDEPIVPLRYRHLIVVKALYWAYRDRRDDTRANLANAEFTDLWLRMSNDNEFGSNRAKVAPMANHYAMKAKRPFSGTRGVVSGSAFDEFRE